MSLSNLILNTGIMNLGTLVRKGEDGAIHVSERVTVFSVMIHYLYSKPSESGLNYARYKTNDHRITK